MMPQNQWLSDGSPLSWGIYRNIPFALMGLLIIVLFYRSAKEHNLSLIHIFGGAVLDVEDFLVSNLFLPLGSLVYLLFCVTRYGWRCV